jgi:isoquinoline 1-oxidoreductase beta subunit
MASPTRPYKIPNFYVGGVMKNTHLPVSFWRSVGGSQNCFFYESFIDELAHAAGKDPYQFRRAMVDRKDFVGVLEKLHEASGWETKLPKGPGRGIAVAENHGSVVGTVAEVTVTMRDRIRVDRMVVAGRLLSRRQSRRSSKRRWNRAPCSALRAVSTARTRSKPVRCRS